MIVAELGDGILGEYGVQDILRDAELMAGRRRVRHGRARPGGLLGRGRADAARVRAARSPPSPGPPPTTRSARTTSPAELGLPAHNARRDAAGCVAWCETRWRDGRRVASREHERRRGRDALATLASRSVPMKVAVIGAAGYAGGELLRLLLAAPRGHRVRRDQPEPGREADRRRAPGARRRSPTRGSPARTPGEAARGRGRRLPLPRARRVVAGRGRGLRAGPGLVVDLAADFRVQDCRALRALLRRAPGAGAGAPVPLRAGRRARRRAARRDARSRRRAASPPRRSSRSIRSRARGLDVTPSLFAVTGSSGAGRAAQARRPTTRRGPTTCSPTRCSATATRPRCSRAGGSGSAGPTRTARLLTHSGPFVRGIYLTLHAYLPPDAAIAAASRARCGRVVPRGLRRPAVRPRARRAARADPRGRAPTTRSSTPPRARTAREVQVSVAIDNLVKGAGGQAMQAMNLALGLDERAGLDRRRDLPMLNATLTATHRAGAACPSTPRCRSARCAATAPGWSTRTGDEWLDAYGGHAVAVDRPQPPATSCGRSPSRRQQLLFYSTAVPHPLREQLAERLAELCPDAAGPGVPLQLRRGSQRERAASRPAAHRPADDRVGARRLARPDRRDARLHRRRNATRTARGARACRSRARCRSTTSRRSMPRWTTTVAAVIVEPVQGFAGARDCSPEFLAAARADLRRARRGADLRRGPVRRRPLRRIHRGGGVRRDARRRSPSPRASPSGLPIGAVVATAAAHRRAHARRPRQHLRRRPGALRRGARHAST